MAIVEGVYRLVGAIAPINQRLGRLRINLIPANVLLMFGLAGLALVSWNSVAKVLAERRPPAPQTVDALISGTRFARGYVAVHGRLMAEAPLSLEAKSSSGPSDSADSTWTPLVDAGNRQGILVQLDAEHALPANGPDVTVEGMLRPLSALVARRLKETKFVHAGVSIDRRFMLVAGRQPGSLQGPLVTGTVCGLLALAFLWSTLTRNVIFLPAEPALSGGRADLLETGSTEPLLVSAKLTLDGKTRRFFTNMPAVAQKTATGETALLSPIVTSSTFFGVKTREQSGIWMLAMLPGRIAEVQAGHVFWGLKKMRATRFRYVNATTGASERAVVASPAPGAAALHVAAL
jgi:hypothetical protein